MIELPTLYCKDAKGDVVQWTVSTDSDMVVVSHGMLGGKQITHRYKAEATNVGRANMRTPVQQAEFEARSAWSKKIDQGYFDDINTARTAVVLLPMLAQKVKAKNIKFPLSAQRKFNGLRCMAIVGADGDVSLMSRGGKEWNIPHIAELVGRLGVAGDIFDGEIYVHGLSLQVINSLVKNEAKDARLALQYHLYDMPRVAGDASLPWEQRWQILHDRHKEFWHGSSRTFSKTDLTPRSHIQLAETRTVTSEDEIKAFEELSIAEGYEGLILRLHGYPYAFGLERPKWLMKWKRFQDNEFEVVDARSRLHDVNGSVMTILDVFVCRNDINEATFEVVPKGSLKQRATMWLEKDKYVGKKLIVRYLERSDAGLPQGNPVGIAFRLDEDVPVSEAEMWND